MAQAPGMRIQLIGGDVYTRHVDFNPCVPIPIALWNHIRIMRMRHRCDHAEGAPILTAGHVE